MSLYVSVIDVSSVSGNARLENLISRLMTKSAVDESDEFKLSSAECGVLLEEALLRHDDSYTWDTLPRKEETPVLILAMKSIAIIRANKVSKQYGVSGKRGSANPGERFDYQMRLAEFFGKDYAEEIQALGVGSDVSMGTLSRFDPLQHAMVPLSQQEGPPSAVLTLSAQGSDSFDILWSEPNISDFYQYRVFYNTEPGLADLTTLNETNPTNTGVDSDATLIATISERHKTALRVSNAEAGTVYYVLVVTADLNGKLSHSNELTVVM